MTLRDGSPSESSGQRNSYSPPPPAPTAAPVAAAPVDESAGHTGPAVRPSPPTPASPPTHGPRDRPRSGHGGDSGRTSDPLPPPSQAPPQAPLPPPLPLGRPRPSGAAVAGRRRVAALVGERSARCDRVGDHGNGGNSVTIQESNSTPGAAVLSGNVTIPQLVRRSFRPSCPSTSSRTAARMRERE